MLQGVDTERDFEDYGLHNYGLAGTDMYEPADWGTHALPQHVGFGAYVDRPVPIVDNSMLGLSMEVDSSDIVAVTPSGRPLVRTKMLEMDPREVAYALRTGAPRPGAVALGDDGDIYQWQYTPVGGFFKKLWSGVKKVAGKVKGAVKKGVRWVGGKAKALIKRLPGGKYLLKVYDKVKKIGMKLVKPLVKYIGPLAKKVAPIAALIPGYGPAVAAALYKVGDMASVLKKYKVKLDKLGRPKFKSGGQAKAVKKALEAKADRMKRKLKKKKKRKKAKRKTEMRAKLERQIRREMERKYAAGAVKRRKRTKLIAPPPPAPRGTAGFGYNPYEYYN